jgi:hypothetical protein
VAKKPETESFKFEVSLSVLNHLGRNLYRNFVTVLGEAISNAWDADAKNVWISIDKDNGVFSIKDDGVGMTADDFQNKFLKIGYSKRASGKMKSPGSRPYIGAKGIGKLALLSCARRVSIFSKKKGAAYAGGVIDNSGLDAAIKGDLTPDQYSLEELDFNLIGDLSKDHKKGTIIVFEETKDQIRNSVAHIKKLIALSFRFSVVAKDFKIHVNGSPVTVGDLVDLANATEFVWLINGFTDEFISALKLLKHKKLALGTDLDVKGFLATVAKPKDLKIAGTEQRATVDLFVNGRLRERNILRHIPSQRIVESYIYGQIHFDAMDEAGKDPFTSSREGIVEDDENFQSLLDEMKRELFPEVLDKWDELRLERGEEGDEENTRKTKKQRKARDLYSVAREEYEPNEDSPARDKVDVWLGDLRGDAEFNISAYVDCFLSENLIRRYLKDQAVALVPGVQAEAAQWKKVESDGLGKANISFAIRKVDDDLSYLSMPALAVSVEGNKTTGQQQTLWSDSVAYTPIRNVVGHTGLLTDLAKQHLTLNYENIKARVKVLMSKVPAKAKNSKQKKPVKKK